MSVKETKRNKKAEKLLAILLLIGVVTLMVLIIVKFFGSRLSTLFTLLKDNDENEISAYLNAEGELSGLFSVFMMSALQVISIFIPGIAVQVVAGVIYGWWKAFAMTYLGFIFGNVLVFSAARRFSGVIKDLMEMTNRKNSLVDKINNYSPAFVLGLAYMIPGIPNGFIPYFASQINIALKPFTVAVAAGSIVQILLNCIAGHYLIRKNVAAVVAVFGLQVILIYLVAKNRAKFLSWISSRQTGKTKDTGADVSSAKE